MAFRLDLPDNANIEGLRCVRVWIPDSDSYESALHSLLTYPNRWFAWQRDTAKQGTVAAQKWRTAYLQTIEDYFAGLSCDDCSDQGGDNGEDAGQCPICGRGGIVILEEEDMGQVVTNVEKITGGIRVYFGPCCYFDIDLTDLDTNPAAEEVWPEEDPPATYYACGKVNFLITYMLALSDAAWANYDNPQTIEAAMRAAVPMATLSRTRIYQWVAQILELVTVGMDASQFNIEDTNQLAKCKAVENVAATASGTGDERGAVVEAMASAYYNDIGILTKTLWFAYWHFVAETIGDEDCRLLLTLGATDDTADCTCPDYDETLAWIDQYDWYYAFSFEGTMPSYWALGTDNGNTIITQRGAELEADTIGSDKVSVSWSPPVQTGTLKRMKVEMLIDDTWIGADPWVGLGFQIGSVGNNLEDDIIGTGGVYTWKDETLGVTPVTTYVTGEANANPTYDPMHIVIARVIVAGDGDDPLG